MHTSGANAAGMTHIVIVNLLHDSQFPTLDKHLQHEIPYQMNAHTHTQREREEAYHEEVVPDLLGYVGGWFEDDGEREGELQREEDADQVVKDAKRPSTGEICKHIAWGMEGGGGVEGG